MPNQDAPQDQNGSSENGKNGTGSNAWPMWQRLVLSEIERHDKEFKEHCDKDEARHKDLDRELGDIRTDIAVRKGKGAVIAAIAGVVVSVLIQIGIYLAKYFSGVSSGGN